MRHIKLFEGVTLSDEVIKLEYRAYMGLFEDGSKRVDLTKYEIENIRRYFKQFPNFKVVVKTNTYQKISNVFSSGKGFVKLDRNNIIIYNRGDKRFSISKIEDEWFLVNIFLCGDRGGFFKVDQIHTLFKLFDENLQNIKRIDVEKAEMERIEKDRILTMRNKLRHKIGIMSVEELDKWTKELGL